MDHAKTIETLGKALDMIIDFAKSEGLEVHGTVAFSSEKETWVEHLIFEKTGPHNHD